MRRCPLLLLPLALAAAALAPLACEPGAATDGARAAAETTADRLLTAGPVELIDQGHWSQVLACSGICVSEYNFWADIAVRNDAFHKQVGILWTNNGWATHQTAWAQYEEPLGDGWERWGVDVDLGQYTSRPREVEFAVFATMSGVTSWDPFNNYYVYDRVSPTAPVRRLTSEVHYEAGVGGVLTGAVRVFDLAFEKEVTVRYTTDGWATSADVVATWKENEDWAFRVEGLGTATLPEYVEFAVRYEVGGAEYWDNNGGQNYRHRMAPEFEPGGTYYDLSRPVSGILTLYGSFRTDLPIARLESRLDSGSWRPDRLLTFSTADLFDGAHEVTLRVTLEGGWQTSGRIPFTVRNRIEPRASWTAPQVDAQGRPLVDPPSSGSAWGLGVDGAGRVYLMRDDVAGTSRIVRYDAWGATNGAFLYDAFPEWTRPEHIAVEADGTVWAIVGYNDKAVFRFRPDGHLDAGFGAGGRLDLGGTYAGEPFCYAGAAAVSAQSLYVLDTCTERVVRFSRDGVFRGALRLPDGDTSIPAATFHDGESLWVLQARTLHRLRDAAGDGLTLAQSIPLGDYEFNSAQGLVRAADGRLWAGNGMDALVAFQADGTVESVWWTTDTDQALDGVFHLPQGVALLPDGDVVVLGAEGARLARFSPDLL